MSVRLGVALIVVAVAMLITASAGASVVSMDRSIAVQVVDDEDANVAVEAVEHDDAESDDATAEADETTTDERELLTVTNRLDEEITPTELEVPDGIENTLWQDGDSIGSGETAILEGTVDCEEIGAEPEASVELSSSGVTISQTVELEVICSDASA
ncbi:hypothetical protein [Natronococcus sp. A-GB7]|uniref:hypothetical protein n=1 Tax=Natronococcus sp. A-GB7 TaxID=3037649 RepID=UPI002420217B|nr:hypothetical protein [Natronococcus sp. A-GB7]MDG5817525.1 hypothetical protein [Natronococcus sp. A-GB7]